MQINLILYSLVKKVCFVISRQMINLTISPLTLGCQRCILYNADNQESMVIKLVVWWWCIIAKVSVKSSAMVHNEPLWDRCYSQKLKCACLPKLADILGYLASNKSSDESQDSKVALSNTLTYILMSIWLIGGVIVVIGEVVVVIGEFMVVIGQPTGCL